MATDSHMMENAGSVNHAHDERRRLQGEHGGRAGVDDAAALDVTQRGAGANMSVDIAAGSAVVAGTESPLTQGFYSFYNDAALNVAINSNGSGSARITSIYAKIQDSEYSGGTNAKSIVAVDGTPSGSPVPPAAPANGLLLANIAVASGAGSITNVNVTEARVLNGLAQNARGEQGTAVLTNTGPGIGTSFVTINGSSITLTTVAQRKYRFMLRTNFSSNIVNDVFQVRLFRDGTTQIGDTQNTCGVAGVSFQHGITCFVEDTPTAGSHSYVWQMVRAAGSGSGTAAPGGNGIAVVDDIGAGPALV